MITWDKTCKMKTSRLLLSMGIFFLSFTVMAQTGEIMPVRKNRFSLYTGLGPNYYFNNLVLLPPAGADKRSPPPLPLPAMARSD